MWDHHMQWHRWEHHMFGWWGGIFLVVLVLVVVAVFFQKRSVVAYRGLHEGSN